MSVGRSRSRAPAVIVGLDFGTHSTKIVMRVRDNETAGIGLFDRPANDYPWFALPSLVRLVDSKLCFGRMALRVAGGSLYRSLKVQLLPPQDEEPVPPSPGPSVELLVALYLSWVMQRLKEALDAHFRHTQHRTYINLAAPMNHVEDEELRSRYLRIVNAAWSSVFGNDPCPASQGASLVELTPRFARWLEEDVPDRTTRTFEVLPETVAPIVSLSIDPRTPPGMYVIVDMGAGTTEFSVDHVGKRGQQILCYRDESVTLGADNLAWIDRSCTDAKRKDEQIGNLVGCFLKVFRKTWGRGYQKDAPNHATRDRWRRINVLLTGGGARRSEIQSAIRSALPLRPWPVGESAYDVIWHQPININFGEHEDRDRSLLAVAQGLSVPRQKWPVMFHPSQVEPQERDPVIDRPPPYWYID